MTDDPKGPEKIDLSAILDEVENTAEESAEIIIDDEAPGAAGSVSESDADPGSLEERHVRLRADFENYRRRVQREKEEHRLRAEENLVADLLPILDNLERALDGPGGEENDPFREGVSMIQRQLGDVLRRAGLEIVESTGQPFDPEVHEAVARQLSTEHPPNTVTDEVLRGYRFHGRLIRPAMVRVSFNEGSGADAGTEDGGSTSAVSGSTASQEDAAE